LLSTEENYRYTTHIVIPKLFSLFNFSYKSDTVVLCHSHTTAVFVNMESSDEDKISTIPLTSGQFNYVTTCMWCKDKGTTFRGPAVANQLFSEPPLISNRFFSELPKTYRRKHESFAYMSNC